ncbi:MAG: hypothetical protein IJW74_03035 [Oscillospiraceae bacterium]|nr:hypothetical protein [Oscillospiraceae bacterium]
MNMINYLNIAVVAVMLLPNIIYAVKVHDFKNLCSSKAMIIAENISRFLCIALMIVPLGQKEFGFPSAESFIIYIFGNIILIAVYLIVWISYFKKANRPKGVVLSVVPPAVFVLCGLTLEHWLLVFAGVLFGISHIYVTSVNSVKKYSEQRRAKKEEAKQQTEQNTEKQE